MDYEMVEYDNSYVTVDDMQQPVFVESDNHAYCNWSFKHKEQPAQQIDHGRSTIEVSHEQERATHGSQAHGALQLNVAAHAK